MKARTFCFLRVAAILALLGGAPSQRAPAEEPGGATSPPDDLTAESVQAQLKLAEENQRLKARLELYDNYLADTMQKTENAELRAEIERLRVLTSRKCVGWGQS